MNTSHGRAADISRTACRASCVYSPFTPNRIVTTPYDLALQRLSRRDLLKIAWALGAAAVATPAYAQRFAGPVTFDAYPFALGVASGDPLPDAVVIWTRLAPHPLEGGGTENRP